MGIQQLGAYIKEYRVNLKIKFNNGGHEQNMYMNRPFIQ
jgi:hypothetical protein